MSEAGDAAPWSRWLWLLVLPAWLTLVGLTVYGMASRLCYPYDLEWMEGGQLAHGWRILHGRPLYPEPGIEWIPYIYPPGHAAVLAALGSVVELGAPVGRVVSWLGTALSMVGITALVGRQGAGPGRWFAGLAAAGVFLGCWQASGAFLDLVRPDALALGLWLVALALAFEKRPALQITAGLLLAAAFAVKHPMAAWGLPVALGLWARDGRVAGALRFGLSALIPAAILVLWLQWSTGGTFLTYLLEVPASHPTVGLRILPGTPWEWGSALPVAVVAAAGWVLWRAVGSGRWAVGLGLAGVAVAVGVAGWWLPEPRGVPYTQLGALSGGVGLAMLAVAAVVLPVRALTGATLDRRWTAALLVGAMGLVVASWMRGHVGGFVNVHLPLFALTAVGVGLAAAHLSRSTVGVAVAVAVIAAQLGHSAWTLDLEHLVPTEEDRRAGDRVVELLSAQEGPVWSPVSPWLAVQAGHEPGPHLIAIWDVGNHRDGPWHGSRDRFTDAVKGHHWGVIVDGRTSIGFQVRRYYYPTERFVLGGRFRPRTGFNNRPEGLWTPMPDQ